MSTIDDIARAAQAVPGIASAAIFGVQPGSSELGLLAAAGIAGPPLEALKAAVLDPAHPIARALTDLGPTFNVQPMNPGGPALRSHLPFDGQGVLALAHELPLSDAARLTLQGLAAQAAAVVAKPAG